MKIRSKKSSSIQGFQCFETASFFSLMSCEFELMLLTVVSLYSPYLDRNTCLLCFIYKITITNTIKQNTPNITPKNRYAEWCEFALINQRVLLCILQLVTIKVELQLFTVVASMMFWTVVLISKSEVKESNVEAFSVLPSRSGKTVVFSGLNATFTISSKTALVVVSNSSPNVTLLPISILCPPSLVTNVKFGPLFSCKEITVIWKF